MLVALRVNLELPAVGHLSTPLPSFCFIMEATLSSIMLKPNKPDKFEGRRDFLNVTHWL